MADPYSPPIGNALHLQLKENPYTPPAGGAIHLQLGGGAPIAGDEITIAATFGAMTGLVNAAAGEYDADIVGTFLDMTGAVDVPTLSADIAGEFRPLTADIETTSNLIISIASQSMEMSGAVDATYAEYQASIAGEFWPMAGNIETGIDISGKFGAFTGSIEATSLVYAASISGEFGGLAADIATANGYDATISGIFNELLGQISTSDADTDEEGHGETIAYTDTCTGSIAPTIDSTDTTEALVFDESSCTGLEPTINNTESTQALAYSED